MRLHTRTTGPRDADAAIRGPVLFVHGFPFDGSMWDRPMAALPDGWLGIAPDLRGFGRSEMQASPDAATTDAATADLPTGREVGHGVARDDEPVLTMDRLADDLAALLREEGGDPAVICGLSMGGYIAFALRRRHPDLVRALVLADTRAGADSDEGRENRRRTAETARERGCEPIARAMVPSLLAETTLRERREVVERVRRMILDTPPATLIAALAGMAERPDSTADLAEIEVPTLVVVGESDSLTPPGEAREMAAAIRGARFEIIPEAGHLAPLENPGAFDRVLGELLRGL